MPFRWVVTEGFKYKPYHCIACGQAPMKDDGLGPHDAVWMEGADVNWGDYLQLCCSCVRIVGELMGMLDPEKVGELKVKIQALEKSLKDAQGERDEYKSLNESMLTGARARKRSKEMSSA
jgi:hypothetical protein